MRLDALPFLVMALFCCGMQMDLYLHWNYLKSCQVAAFLPVDTFCSTLFFGTLYTWAARVKGVVIVLISESHLPSQFWGYAVSSLHICDATWVLCKLHLIVMEFKKCPSWLLWSYGSSHVSYQFWGYALVRTYYIVQFYWAVLFSTKAHAYVLQITPCMVIIVQYNVE